MKRNDKAVADKKVAEKNKRKREKKPNPFHLADSEYNFCF